MRVLRVKGLILALLASAMLAGCGGNGSGEKNESTPVAGYSENDTESKTEKTPENEDDKDSNEGSTSEPESGAEVETADYPVIEAVDYSGMELETISNSKMSYSYPAGEWEKVFDDPLQIAWEETIGTNQAVNINMNLEVTGIKGSDWMDDMMEQLSNENLESAGYGINVKVSEVRSLNGNPVVYMEVLTQITDEMIDMMIDSGVYTEEMIEAAGGRETLLAVPPTTQIAIYTAKDGNVFSCTGTYYAEDQKQDVLDTMTILLGTAEKN